MSIKQIHKQLADALSECKFQSNGTLIMSNVHVDRLKDLVRADPEHGPCTVWNALKQFFCSHSIEKRAAALHICDIFFQRSEKFRLILLDDIDGVKSLFDYSKINQTNKLERFEMQACRVLNGWDEKFGRTYRLLSSTIRHFKKKLRHLPRFSSPEPYDSTEHLKWEFSQALQQAREVLPKLQDRSQQMESVLEQVLGSVAIRVGAEILETAARFNASDLEPTSSNGDGLKNMGSGEFFTNTALINPNYEVEILVNKINVRCDPRRKKFLEDGAKDIQARYFPQLISWEQKLHPPLLAADNILNQLYLQVGEAKGRLSKILQKLDNIVLTSDECSSDPEMEDVPL
jgi:hypothetical protein